MAVGKKEKLILVTNQLKNIRSGVGTLANALIKRLYASYDLLVICPEEEFIDLGKKGILVTTIRKSLLDITDHKWLSFSVNVNRYLSKVNLSQYSKALFMDAREGLFFRQKIKTVGIIHDFYSVKLGRLSLENIRCYPDWLKRFVYFKCMFLLERTAYGRFTYLVTVSNYCKNILLNDYRLEKRIGVIHNGIDLEILKKSHSAKEKFSILFAGGNFYRKGLPSLIEAIFQLKTKYPLIKCYVAGTDRNQKKIHKMTKDLGLVENIIFLGRLDYSSISQYFQKCEIFCMPSLYESFGLVYLEALFYEMNVIASRNSGIIEFADHFENLFFVDPKNSTDLVHIIEDIFDNNYEVKQCDFQAISSDVMGRKYLELLRGEASGGKTSRAV